MQLIDEMKSQSAAEYSARLNSMDTYIDNFQRGAEMKVVSNQEHTPKSINSPAKLNSSEIEDKEGYRYSDYPPT